MPTNAHGTLLYIWDPAAAGGAGDFVEVAAIGDINGPGVTQEAIDVTTHQSTWREYIAGLPDGGEVSFQIKYDPADASHALLRGAASDSAKHQFKVAFQSGNTATFDGIVTSFAITAPVDEALVADMTVKITGPVTWA